MNADGSLSGLLAGYRPWFPIYRGWVEARGSMIEQLTRVQPPGVWYALKRNVDYSPEGANGENSHLLRPAHRRHSPVARSAAGGGR